MFIIESNKQLTQLLTAKYNYKLLFPVWSTYTEHELTSTISFIYCVTNDKSYIINLQHIDANQCSAFDLNQLVSEETLVYGNRYVQSNGIDYEFAHSETYGTQFNFKEFFADLYRNYKREAENINDSIPIMKWMEKLQTLPIPAPIKPWYSKYSQAINVLGNIEGAGVKVDTQIFTSLHIHSGFAYTRYNPYTITGRPSNSHGGINWAALPKADGQREGIISRFPGGTLIGMDYESYHLRLIARMAGYSFPDGVAAHTHLAEWYEVDTETAKGITFKWLYGGIPDEGLRIPFFRATADWMEGLWQSFVINGKLVTPVFGREIPFSRIESPTKEKVMNYYVQATETEINYSKMALMESAMMGMRSKPVLYTYDAILLDCHPDEMRKVIADIQSIMEKGGFPVRVYAGENYGKMNFIQ